MVRVLTWDEAVRFYSVGAMNTGLRIANDLDTICPTEAENNALRWTAESLFELGRVCYDHIFFHAYEGDDYEEIEAEIMKGVNIIAPVILSRLDLIENQSDEFVEMSEFIKREWLSFVQCCKAVPIDDRVEDNNEGTTLFILY